MSDSQDFQALLVQHLVFIERMAAKFCRRDSNSEQAADFVSWAQEKLLENDCAKLRKFRGQSSFTTYLAAVLFTLYRDFLVAMRGRWRPSAEARRRGADAMALERLIYRDRNTLDEAISILRTRGETRCSERELRALYSLLPTGNRGRPQPAGDLALAVIPSRETADRPLAEEEADAERSRIYDELQRVLGELPPDDGAILHMRFYEGASIADIGRALRLEQKPLYRRVERALAGLREKLEAAGISRADIAALLRSIEN